MIHKISIRDLNTLANQLPKNVPFKKIIQDMVLEAVAKKQTHILFDDQDKVDAIILEGLPLAKTQEKLQNQKQRMIKNQTPYVSVQEYILRGGKL